MTALADGIDHADRAHGPEHVVAGADGLRGMQHGREPTERLLDHRRSTRRQAQCVNLLGASLVLRRE